MAAQTPSTPATPDAVLRALADPHRRQILRLVKHTELPAGRIAASFTLTQQAVSLHIGVLKRAGLLTERREGTRRLHALPPGGSTVEVVLTPDGDDTMVVLTHAGLPATHLGSHRDGWEEQLGHLPAVVG